MENRISLSTALIKKIMAALPAAHEGRFEVNLGAIGWGYVPIEELVIEPGAVQAPLVLRPGKPLLPQELKVGLRFTHWEIHDKVLWFRLEKLGKLQGPVFHGIQKGLFALLEKLGGDQSDGTAGFRFRNDRIGIPLATVSQNWLQLPPSIEIAAIKFDNGCVIHLQVKDTLT